jgi:hypothetical protein
VDSYKGIEYDPNQVWPDWKPAKDPKPINYLSKLLGTKYSGANAGG